MSLPPMTGTNLARAHLKYPLFLPRVVCDARRTVDLRLEGVGCRIKPEPGVNVCDPLGSRGAYMGTSLVRNSPPPKDHHRILGIDLL
jgi:hypothetical protein